MAVDVDPQMLFKLALAVVCGAVIGVERETRGRAAGLRTMILVCLGSTLIMIVSVGLAVPPEPAMAREVIRIDPGRIAAGIVTGIGFLGGAVVVKLGDVVRGVTTAASIWLAAAIGIVIGQGHYWLAIAAVVIALLVLSTFGRLERRIKRHVYRAFTLISDAAHGRELESRVRSLFDTRDIRVLSTAFEVDAAAGQSRLTLNVRALETTGIVELVAALADLDGVRLARSD